MENQRMTKSSNIIDLFSSPINRQKFTTTTRHRHSPVVFDPYASDSSESSTSPLMKYFPVVVAPVNVEEDVIVMDGITVPKNRVERNRTMRSSSSPSGNLVEGGGIRVDSNDNHRNSKLGGHQKDRTLLCQSWENRGMCKFGSQCQFAHGKEDLRPSRSSNKTNLSAVSSLYNTHEGSRSSLYGPRSPSISQVKAAASSPEAFTLSSTRMASPSPNNEIKKPSQTVTAQPKSDWNPLDDKIDVALPSGEKNPPREDVEDFITKILYGNGKSPRKRLPVFHEICPD